MTRTLSTIGNQVGGIVWRQDLMAASLSVNTQDNYYWYDGLYQVQEHQRGQLNGTAPNYTGIVNTQQDETFGYDPTGNWATSGSLNPTNSQVRTSNVANEITGVTNSAGFGGAFSYDAAGNATEIPEIGWAGGRSATYDAWNRMVGIEITGGIPAAYSYDGLTRRIVKTAGAPTQHFYYSNAWQVLQVNSEIADPFESSSSSYHPIVDVTQFVWGLRGIDDLILRREDNYDQPLQQLYSLSDQWNVVAITDQTATVQQRYAYNAFGLTLFMIPSFDEGSAGAFNWETTFCSYRLDQESELYQVRYRYLNPIVGVWLTRDPLTNILRGMDATRSTEVLQGPNLYEYVDNDPILNIDMLGLGSGLGWNPNPNSESVPTTNTPPIRPTRNIQCEKADCENNKHGKWTTYGEANYGSVAACVQAQRNDVGINNPWAAVAGDVSGLGAAVVGWAGAAVSTAFYVGYAGLIIGGYNGAVAIGGFAVCNGQGCFDNNGIEI